MKSRTWWIRAVPAVVVAGWVLGGAGPVDGQMRASPPSGGVNWGLYDALGYGGLGFAVGLAAVWDLEGDGFGPPGEAIVILGATTLGGVLGGAMLGSRARRRVAEGREISEIHRVAALGGVVLAGGIAGALATIPMINGEGEGTPFGSDEHTITLFVVSGAALGFVFAWKHRGELAGRPVTVQPTTSAERGLGLRMRVSF